MKNVKQTLLLVLILSSLTFVSCNEYKSFSSASKVSQLGGNPFLYNLSKGMLKDLKNNLIENGLKGSIKNMNLTTPLATILKTPDQITKFKTMLNTIYMVPTKKMDAQWGNLGSVKDLVSFVAKNGKKFNFYSK